MTIKLHVGYVGKTRDGKRVEIVECDGDKYWGYKGNDGEWYREDGRFSVKPSQYDIIGPWEDEPAPDYNNGEWWGWNGGECPVHPETVVEYCWKEGTNTADARQLNWNMRLNGLYAFRVVTHTPIRRIRVSGGFIATAHMIKSQTGPMNQSTSARC